MTHVFAALCVNFVWKKIVLDTRFAIMYKPDFVVCTKDSTGKSGFVFLNQRIEV